MLKLLLIGIGSFVGGVARFGMVDWVQRMAGPGFPYGTLAVNVLGCTLIGLGATLAEQRVLFSPEIRGMLFIGALGSFTTFSSFSYETLQLAQTGDYLPAVANVLLSVVLSLLAVWLGSILGKVI